jgi:hypothetical protein
MPSALEERLTRQLAAKGNDNAAEMAHTILVERGHISADGTLTAEGKKRQDLGAEGRAKDRASKASGHRPSDFKYDPKTNRATLKGQ